MYSPHVQVVNGGIYLTIICVYIGSHVQNHSSNWVKSATFFAIDHHHDHVLRWCPAWDRASSNGSPQLVNQVGIVARHVLSGGSQACRQ